MLSLQSDILATRRRGVDPFRPDCLPAFSIEHNDERRFFFLSLRRVIGCSYAFAIANVAYAFARYSNGTIEWNGRSWISGMDSRFFDHPAKRVFSTSSFSTSLLHATVARFSILDPPPVPRIYAVCDRYPHDGSSLRDRTIVKVSLEEKY